MSIYLDYAAATPIDTEVLAAMQPFYTDQFYNPSALYRPALLVSRALEAARADVAYLLGAKPTEVIFYAGGTEANNSAIHGVMKQILQHHPAATMLISAVEHDSVRIPTLGFSHTIVQVDASGLVDPGTLTESVTQNTALVSVMYANNEVGSVQPIKRIAAVLSDIKRARIADGNNIPLYFHVDAAQAGNYLDLHVHRLGVDLMTLNGGKLYGPKQSGVLYVRSGVQLMPLIQGGGQERNLRSGTENIAGAVGFAKALQRAVNQKESELKRLKELQKNFTAQIMVAFPAAIINGSLKHRLPNNLHVTIPGTDNERLLMALDMMNIYAAAGSACSASHDEPSHVLAAMGIVPDAIRSSLRFSMGRQTTAAEIDQTVVALQHIVPK